MYLPWINEYGFIIQLLCAYSFVYVILFRSTADSFRIYCSQQPFTIILFALIEPKQKQKIRRSTSKYTTKMVNLVLLKMSVDYQFT